MDQTGTKYTGCYIFDGAENSTRHWFPHHSAYTDTFHDLKILEIPPVFYFYPNMKHLAAGLTGLQYQVLERGDEGAGLVGSHDSCVHITCHLSLVKIKTKTGSAA